MKRKIVCSVTGLLVVLVLVLASCGTPTEITSTTATTPKTSTPTGTTPSGTTTAPPPSESPKYGGTLIRVYGQDVNAFDEVFGFHAFPTTTIHLTNEELWTGDWSKGPSGTNLTGWEAGGLDRKTFKIGAIAESWDLSTPGTMTWHLRKGIKWALNPASEASKLVNGRELVANDVIFSLKQIVTHERSFLRNSFQQLRAAEFSAPDKSTAVIKIAPADMSVAVMHFADFCSIVPPEVVQKYGSMQDWRNSVGTGPFMLTDVVVGSSVTLVKNPTYWDKDPVGPGKGNQLPYLDSVKYLIIPDTSTQQAAFRTGKIDILGTDWETQPRLMKEHPELKFGTSVFDGGFETHFNVTKSPYSDLKVRRALMMGVDFNNLVKTLFGGTAEIVTWPVTFNKQYSGLFLGLDDPQCPASVKELYTYSPDKAKALLKEAGFPNGFKTTVICSSAAAQVDYYSVLKEMWSKINVDLTIDQRENAVWTSIYQGRAYDALVHSSMGGLGSAYIANNYNGDGFANASYVDDKVVKEAIVKMQAALDKGGEDAADPIHKELMKYVLDQAWAIPYPKAPSYRMWWPWVKNYHGEFGVGYWNEGNYAKWTWIDPELKQKIAGK